MRNKLKQLLAAVLCLCGCTPTPAPKPIPFEKLHWAAYYDTKLPAEDFAQLDLVVFDGRHYPDFKRLHRTTKVLAYVTIGETYHNAPDREILEREGMILTKNQRWNSYVVDMRSPTWRKIVMASVDHAVDKGFDGVMLDTVDSPLEWARVKGTSTQAEMQQAAISLIHEIRHKYPTIKIMLNRGFVIAPKVAFDIDYLLAESILTTRDEITGQYRLLPPKDYSDAVRQLHTLIARAEQVRILTLDYWDMDDADGLDGIYKIQRQAGFHPYVTTPDLKHFTPEQIHRKPHVTE